MNLNNILSIGYFNIRGQTGLSKIKELQIESIMKQNQCDILHLQEANIDEESFSSCDFIKSSYIILENNSLNKYGTASLVKSDLEINNIKHDMEGRVLLFDVGDITVGNIYLPSGTDGISRAKREKYCCEVLPGLLLNSKDNGTVGGDFNCIVDKRDATNYPEAKFSKGLERLIRLKNWQDSFRSIHPTSRTFSRYYGNARAEGATRIDQNYHYGELTAKEVKYIPLAFSDHLGLIVRICLPDAMARILSPRSRPSFRLRPEVIKDNTFKQRLEEAMVTWERVKAYQGAEVDTLYWWEHMVKPGIRKLGIQRSKEINKERREELNLLILRQLYYVRKVQEGHWGRLGELKTVNLLMEKWYQRESEKIQHQSRVQEFQESEKSLIYHHELHKRSVRKTSILELQTVGGLLKGHNECSAFLEESVEDLLLHPAQLDAHAQQSLLSEVHQVFTEEDNSMLLTPPTRAEVLNIINNSNLHAAPGNDGLPSFIYKECWPILGPHITEVMKEIFQGKSLPPSMRTSLMVFGSKPKKPHSKLPNDKRKISLLNSDFKIATGLEAAKLKATTSHTLSHLQLVAGSSRRIHHGINLARNAIFTASKPGHPGCGILDTDLIAAFDYLCMEWVFKVLEKKGLHRDVILRLHNLYSNSVSIVVVNNIQGKAVKNIRLSLRQGDLPSMHFFSFGIDPLLCYLERRLHGILVCSLPTQGPALQGQDMLPPTEERFKVLGYADDVKPAITSMVEFLVVDKAMSLFEQASGCRLHRDPASRKCKFLPLARWKGTLQQEDVPCPYMTISDHLDMLGVELRSTWLQTRKANGDISQTRVENTIRQWKAGKFMMLSMRSWSLNQYCLSKIWFRTHSVDLRVLDCNRITSQIKSWLYADLLLKPEEQIMWRPPASGGLGVLNVKLKAQACLIKSFLETVDGTEYIPSLYHSMLFRYHVLCDTTLANPGTPPFYNSEFFQKIRKVHNDSPLNILRMNEKEWYRLLLEDNISEVVDEVNQERRLNPCRVERLSPETDWDSCWRLSRLAGLGSENVSFLMKLIHQILPTQERVARAKPHLRPDCKAHGCEGGV